MITLDMLRQIILALPTRGNHLLGSRVLPGQRKGYAVLEPDP